MKIIIKVPIRSVYIGTDSRYPEIPIYYSPLVNETEYTLDIPLRTKIETLRDIIRDRENLPSIPNPGIRLLSNGSDLAGNSLLDCDINENSIIIVYFRTRG